MGGCFFDALAQALNQARNTKEFSEKSLRTSCHQYYLIYKEEVNKWNVQDSLAFIKDEDYCFVQYTTPELNKDFNSRSPIWGRAQVEGRILCHQLRIECIHLIELGIDPANGQHMATHFGITVDGEKQIDALRYDSNVPTIIVSQKGLHCVPILLSDETYLEKKQEDSLTPDGKEQPQPLLPPPATNSIAPQ